MAVNTKHSRQREALLETLRNREDHPTAEQLYIDLKPQIPKLSLGTVYRNLSLLEEQGELARVSVAGNTERYDGKVHEHYHFSCNECGALRDISLPVIKDIDEVVESITNADVKSHSLIFYGICEKCKKKSLTNEIVVL